MPGIVGFITTKRWETASLDLKRMVDAVSHESFYRTGQWIDEFNGIYVGWTARENSFADGMPVRNEKGDALLVFSGEEFPEPETVCQLRNRGHEVPTEGPSYLIHLYEEDPRFPLALNGMFHGLLVDLKAGTATLFNDRYGLHRIYCHEREDILYFAVEAKAILAVCPELRELDPRGLGEFAACGCVMENRSLFKGIDVLPPASSWVFRRGAIEKKAQYFNPHDCENQERLDPEAYYRELRDVFSRNLPRYFSGHEKIGISLTGGLDTRVIMAWHRSPAGSLPCYTFGGTYRDCRDVRIARKVSRLCQQPYQIIPVGEDFLKKFPLYAERAIYLTDGCVNVSRAADLYVNELARGIAPVRMTGLFGDEILRHNRTFKAVQPSSGIFVSDILHWTRAAQETYCNALKANPLFFSAYRQTPWHHYGNLALERTQVAMRTPFLDNDLVRTVFRAPASATSSNYYRLRLIEDGDPALRRIRTDLGFGGKGLFRGRIIERFQEFTFKAEYAYDHGMPQWMARIDHMLSAFHLERLFLGRHKFCHFRIWYRDALADYVREMLLDSRTLSRPYVDRKALEAVVTAHTRGTANYTTEIHQVLTLELLHRSFVDLS